MLNLQYFCWAGNYLACSISVEICIMQMYLVPYDCHLFCFSFCI
uniref:Uncharacterized protein n=1 Tax=Anguilla anguilla TaxID=7936 RepID=A0A0E9V7W2_ANGAN